MKAFFSRLINPLVWRVPGHPARVLFGFSLAEHGSMLDLSAATRLTSSPQRAAAYMRHMLDEARHARMFAARSAELRLQEGQPSLGYPVADTENLFQTLGELRFLAFVHVGEKRGRAQFETYRDWFEKQGDHKSGAMFAAIVRDELRHEQYTYDLLLELAGSEAQANKELRAVVLWETWRKWRRMGRFLAEKLYFAVMTFIYILWGPVMYLAGILNKGKP
ncbi:MAG: ferritin-like domain-containing protein [Limnobacter sp.]|nr:ferritin-like domain-containing protein [Limnobacter sp.]